MIRAFYTASSGLVAQAAKQDIIANNIANVQTAGFKRNCTVSTTTFSDVLKAKYIPLKERSSLSYPDSPVQPEITSVQDKLDLTEGPIQETGNNLDFAISGPGSFEVISANGSTRLTRAGNFRVNADNELVTADGSVVQGDSGAIKLTEGKVSVNSDGTILVNGVETDKIKIVGEEQGKTQVMQGYIEQSNVNVVREMVDMITNMRAFEANQKVISSVDQTLDKLINDVGKIG